MSTNRMSICRQSLSTNRFCLQIDLSRIALFTLSSILTRIDMDGVEETGRGGAGGIGREGGLAEDDAAEAGDAVDGSEEDGRGDDGRSTATASPLNYYF